MKNIRVSLKERSYDIAFGSVKHGLLPAVKNLDLDPTRIFFITTRAVEKAGHARMAKHALKKLGVPLNSVVFPNGEGTKTIQTVEKLHRSASREGLDRKSLVVAMGGGVLTDLGGFFAATFMRGISFISIPTTLLGMVDAAIGGKTGVDLPEGKNLVGAFWQPKLVFIDVDVLKTLPRREWQTGMSEVIKYGVILDRTFFGWLEDKISEASDPRRWSKVPLLHAIRTSVALKARVVSRDEKETPLAGGREILNFGHTTGHALEAALGYRHLTHGEAVSIGMSIAYAVAVRLNLGRASEAIRLRSLLKRAGLPTHFPNLSPREMIRFWQALRHDKKNVGQSLRFVLPVRLGRANVYSGIRPVILRDAIKGTDI